MAPVPWTKTMEKVPRVLSMVFLIVPRTNSMPAVRGEVPWHPQKSLSAYFERLILRHNLMFLTNSSLERHKRMFPEGTEPCSRLPTSETHCQLVAGTVRAF